MSSYISELIHRVHAVIVVAADETSRSSSEIERD